MRWGDLPAPFAPFDELSLLPILAWYLVYYLLAVIVSGIGQSLWESSQEIVMTEETDFGLREVVSAGPLEEMLFRGIAVGLSVHVWGWGPIGVLFALLIANGVWAGSHQRRFGTFLFTFVLGIYLTRFWYLGFDGLWWMAIVMHSVHNAFVTGVGEWLGEDREIDPRRRPKPS